MASVNEVFSEELSEFKTDAEQRIKARVDAEVAKAQPELVALRATVGNFKAELDKAKEEGRTEGREEGRLEGWKEGASDMLAEMKSWKESI